MTNEIQSTLRRTFVMSLLAAAATVTTATVVAQTFPAKPHLLQLMRYLGSLKRLLSGYLVEQHQKRQPH